MECQPQRRSDRIIGELVARASLSAEYDGAFCDLTIDGLADDDSAGQRHGEPRPCAYLEGRAYPLLLSCRRSPAEDSKNFFRRPGT